mmetsp:Transcript_35457/g.92345  ORF Transcript_35457/g.92345 Transcript_35457/m.92345 type:complete len:230 (-) Transcript_35457:1206-1895(-)
MFAFLTIFVSDDICMDDAVEAKTPREEERLSGREGRGNFTSPLSFLPSTDCSSCSSIFLFSPLSIHSCLKSRVSASTVTVCLRGKVYIFLQRGHRTFSGGSGCLPLSLTGWGTHAGERARLHLFLHCSLFRLDISLSIDEILEQEEVVRVASCAAKLCPFRTISLRPICFISLFSPPRAVNGCAGGRGRRGVVDDLLLAVCTSLSPSPRGGHFFLAVSLPSLAPAVDVP